MRHYPGMGSASDWLNQISLAARPIRSTTQIWVVTRHQYGISALVSQTSLGGETSGSVDKCRLFSQVYWSTDMSTNIWPILDRYIDQHIGRLPLKDTRSRLFTVLVDSSSLQSAWQGSQWRVRTAPYFSHKREIIGKTNVLQIVLGTDKHWETKSMHIMI